MPRPYDAFLEFAAGEMRPWLRAQGVRGAVLADDDAPRGVATNREVVGEFEAHAQAVIVTSGRIGGDHDLVRRAWPERLGTPPTHMLSGVPAHVDGRMLGIAERQGARVINADRMWHYVEGRTAESRSPRSPPGSVVGAGAPSSDQRCRIRPGSLTR